MDPATDDDPKSFGNVLERGPASTFWRLVIAVILISVTSLALFIVLYVYVPDSFLGVGSSSVTSATAFALFGTSAAMLNWVYQAGNRRLGAVDLFGCEISAICRVCLVVDFAQVSVEEYEKLAAQIAEGQAVVKPYKFTSAENYTPVYDRNLADLQALDVNVVTCVTEFYTYRKTMMDFLRSVADASDAQTKLQSISQMIYMQFLMYESGRLAVQELIEFEPNQAESLINILCSELPLFAFLLDLHAADFKGKRLRLRIKNYQEVVPKELRKIAKAKKESGKSGRYWDRAITSASELRKRYTHCATVFPHRGDQPHDASDDALE